MFQVGRSPAMTLLWVVSGSHSTRVNRGCCVSVCLCLWVVWESAGKLVGGTRQS